MSSRNDTAPAITVTAGKGTPPVPYYEAVWHEPQPTGRTKPAKQRIGRAWLEPDGVDRDGRPVWRKRRGRVPDGFYDERRAHAAASEAVARWRARQAARVRAPESDEDVTVRRVAHEWLGWLRDVKGAAPSTVRDYEALLREPGTKARRGEHVSAGRIMKAFGDRPVAEVTVREVATWLRELDGEEGMAPRNVNKHRQVLGNVFSYAMRPDTYSLEANPVRRTDKRPEPPPGRLDYFEAEEVEALAREAAKGAHRVAEQDRQRTYEVTPEEAAARAQQDRQDGELFRVMLYSGLRIGEARALRWKAVTFVPDMSGAVLDVRYTVSATQEKAPKSSRPRTVPVPRPAAEALARLQMREHFVGDDDYVFVNRTGGRLEDSSIRRRYKAAREAAGLRDVKLHGLRHAAGSIIAQGAGALAARDVLGHAKLSTTDRYMHGKADVRAVATMNAAFGVADLYEAGSDKAAPGLASRPNEGAVGSGDKRSRAGN